MSDDECGLDPKNRHLREAARWRVKLQRPDLSPRQLLRWSKWLESPKNREAFDALEPIWRVIHSPVGERSRQLTPPRSPYKWYRSIGLAAIAASLVLAGILTFLAQDYTPSEHVVTTGASQLHHRTLPDGTAVHVDAHSKVEVEYTADARIVHVYEGDAVFDVAKDSKRPFIARTELVDVTAVGTRFGVSVGAGVTTTVSEGVVEVTSHHGQVSKTVTVKAGEELRVADGGPTSLHIARVDAERKLQWTSGWLMLGGLPVSEGVRQMNRRNRMQIVLESPRIGERVLAFVRVKVDSPESYARMVADQHGLQVDIDTKNGVIRLSE